MAVANVAAPVAPVVAPTLEVDQTTAAPRSYYQTKYNEFVDWTSRNTCDLVRTTCQIRTEGTQENPADSTMMKVARVFIMVLTCVITVPCASLVATFKWIKENVCGTSVASLEQPNAPPVVKPAEEKPVATVRFIDPVPAPAPVQILAAPALAAAPAPAPALAAAPAPALAAAPAPALAAAPAPDADAAAAAAAVVIPAPADHEG
jgi:hypothetical protein